MDHLRARSGVILGALWPALVALLLCACASAGDLASQSDLGGHGHADAGKPTDGGRLPDLRPRPGADLSSPPGADLLAPPDATVAPLADLSLLADLRVEPLADLSVPPLADLSVPPLADLSVPPLADLTVAPGRDLTNVAVDQALPVDSAMPLDFAILPDLARLPDLLPPPDLAMPGGCVPQTMPCDVHCQNCPANQRCTLDANSAPVCAPIGNTPPDAVCARDTCVKGATCVTESNLVFPFLSICRLFCTSDADCTNGGRCVVKIKGTSYLACSEKITNCDPVLMIGCPMGTSCYPVTPDGLTGCHLAGVSAAGALCDSSYDCVPGDACITLIVPACHKLCHLGMNADCAGGNPPICIPSKFNSYGSCN